MLSETTPYFEVKQREVAATTIHRAKQIRRAREALLILQRVEHLKQLTNQHTRLYYLFLTEYFTQRTIKTAAIFHSIAEIARLVAQRARKIKKETGNQFLTTHHNHLMRWLKDLTDKGFIIRQDTAIEQEKHPYLFADAKPNTKRKSWQYTLQPVYESRRGEYGLAVIDGLFERIIPLERVRDVLGEFLLGDYFLTCGAAEHAEWKVWHDAAINPEFETEALIETARQTLGEDLDLPILDLIDLVSDQELVEQLAQRERLRAMTLKEVEQDGKN